MRLKNLPHGQVIALSAIVLMPAGSHLMRISPLGIGSSHASRLFEALRVAVMDLVRCGLSLGAWEQATLPEVLGIQDPVQGRAEARLAALVGFQKSATSCVGVPMSIFSSKANDFDDRLLEMQGKFSASHDILANWARDPKGLDLADNQRAKQSWWADQVSKARKA